ncbi:MAG: ATP-binding protein [Clostridiales bacterium]|nr:ATP-binding protein [Clostridiales bacterium]
MAELLIPVGRVCAGKTTYLRAQEGLAVLSVDDLMTTMFDACPGPERQRDAEDRAVRYLLRCARNLLDLGVDCAIDYGFWYRSQRQAVRRFCGAQGIACRVLYFDVPQAVRLERLLERNLRLADAPKREYIMTPEMLRRFDTWFEAPGPKDYDERIAG